MINMIVAVALSTTADGPLQVVAVAEMANYIAIVLAFPFSLLISSCRHDDAGLLCLVYSVAVLMYLLSCLMIV